MANIPTAEELYELVDQIECCTTPHPYWCYDPDVQMCYVVGVSNKCAIKFFKDCDYVIVIDRKGRKWRKGKRWYDDGRKNNT